MKYVFDAVELERMAGVRSTLEPCHYVVLRRQYVHNLSFTFVAPLKAQ